MVQIMTSNAPGAAARAEPPISASPRLSGRRRVWRLVREGSINADPATMTSRTDQFAAGLRRHRTTTVVTIRTDAGLEHYLIAPSVPGVDSSALALAHSVAARLIPAEHEVPDLRGGGEVVSLRYAFDDTPTHSTQAGVDLSELSRSLGSSLQVGDWVAMAMRAPRWGERRRWNNWLAYRMQTKRPVHHSTRPRTAVVNVYAGSSDVESARGLADLVAAGLPGFDVLSKSRRPDRLIAPTLVGLLGIPLAFVVGAVTGAWSLAVGSLTQPDASGVALFTLGSTFTATIATLAVMLVASAAMFAGVVPFTRAARVRRGLSDASFPTPRSRLLPPRPPRKFSTVEGSSGKDGDGGSYPLYPTCFMVGGTLPAALVAPQSGALSGQESTSSGHAPVAVTRPVGPRLGTTAFGEVTHLSARDLTRGVMLFGSPGMGKSELSRNITAWMSRERVAPSGLPGFPGSRNAMVVFATKSSDMARTVEWFTAMGDRIYQVELADPDPRGLSIDLFAVPGTVADKAEHMVNALIYAFGEQAIGPESKRSIKAVLAAGLCVEDTMARNVEGVQTGRSPIYYACILLGLNGLATARALAAQVRTAADDPKHPAHEQASVAWAGMGFMFGPGVSDSVTTGFQKAPGNKLEQLLTIDHYFAPTRRKRSFTRVLQEHSAVIVQTGRSASGHMLEASTSALMGSLLMFSLRHHIELTCSGWEKQGRFVTIAADELVELVGSSPEIVEWLRSRGRDYGVIPLLATQNPLQLSDAVRNSLMSYSTLVAFKQDTPVLAAPLAADLAASDEHAGWSVGSLMKLEPYHAVVRMNVDYRAQVPFVVAVDFYGDPNDVGRFDRFVADQPGGAV